MCDQYNNSDLSMTSFVKAVASNNVDATRAFLDAGIDPNMSLQNNGVPVLESVLYFGFMAMAELFVSRGARVRPGYGLDAASGSGNLPLLQWVYSAGVDQQINSSINFLASKGTPEATKVAIAQWFISVGADPQRWAEASMTIPNCQAVAKMLVSQGLFDAKAQTSTIRRGTVDERVSIEDFLAARKIEHPYTLAVLPDKSNELFVAIRNNDVAQVQALLAAVPPPDLVTPLHASTGSPLQYATRRGAADIVKALVNAGASEDATDPTELLLAAVESGNVALLAPLLSRRAGTPVPPQALRSAVANANVAVVYALLAAGADPNGLVGGVPPLGTVALTARTSPTTARPEHVAVVYALLGSGANADLYVPVLYATPKAYCVRNSSALAAAVGWK